MMHVVPAGACALAIVASASGQITLLSDVRQISASSAAANATMSDAEGPLTFTPSAFGAIFDESANPIASVLGAGAPCGASQFSEILGSGITLQGSVSGIASVSAASGGISASCAASSSAVLSFSVPAGTQLSFQGSSSGVGGFTITQGAQVLIQNLGVVNLTTTQPTTFTINAAAQFQIQAPPAANAGGGFSILVTAVPAPSAAALLVFAGAFASRRRAR